MRIRLGNRKQAMKHKYKALGSWHRWFAWYPVKIRVTTVDSNIRYNDYAEELHWLTPVQRHVNNYWPLWIFPKLYFFTYYYDAWDEENPLEDPLPDLIHKYNRIYINKILHKQKYEEKLRKKIPAAAKAFENYNLIMRLSYDEKLLKED